MPVEWPYQAQAAQTLWLLDTFGFERPVLLGSGLGAGVALLIAAWYPSRLAGLVEVNPGLTHERCAQVADLAEQEPAWRAWLDAPPAWARLERRLTCPVLRVRSRSTRRVLASVRTFLDSHVQSDPCC
jgi:pimeloyl-ACP methyl ester carboxylesterase